MSAGAHPLSPLQQGMLVQALLAPEAGVDLEQLVFTLREPIQADALREAFRQVSLHHPVLRTAFRWDGEGEPEQRAVPHADPPFEARSLVGQSTSAIESTLAEFLRADRQRGFDPATPPLQRVTLFQLAEGEFRLIWTFHHILLDGRSFAPVIEDLFSAYASLCAGLPVHLPPRPLYTAYLDWVSRLDHRRSKPFWEQALSGVTVPTKLPLAHARALPSTVDGWGTRAVTLPASLTTSLKTGLGAHGIRLSTVVEGAWALLLARFSGDAEVVLGVTRACRRTALDGAGAGDRVGVVINTLPLRLPVPLDAPAVAWLADVQARSRALAAHEHTPLVTIRAFSGLPADRPLFESLLVYEDYLLDTRLRAQGGAWERRSLEVLERTGFPLTLSAYGGETLLLRLSYDEGRFDGASVGRLLDCLSTLLHALADDPTCPLGALPLLSAAERRRVLALGDATRPAIPEGCLHQLVERAVDRAPDAIALIDGEEEIAYRDLDRRANQLAHALRARGVGPDVLVGLCAERTAELVIGVLAILKAGGAYVPLDPTHPRPRLAQILEDSAVRLVLVGEAQRTLFGDTGPDCLVLGASSLAREPVARPESGVGARDLAYVLFTSGSTGRPKGVAIEHRSPVCLIDWARSVFPPEACAGVLFSTSLGFDLSVFEIFLALASGGALILAENALALPVLSASRRVTLVNTVPTAITELLSLGGLPPSVTTLCLAGEPLLEPLAERVYAETQVERLYNLYGPTEDTTYSTFTSIARGGGVPSIGHPISHGRAYLLDARREPVPEGMTGEIYLGGAGLARGYWGRPDLTAERFVPDPFDAGERLYRTGDLGRHREDGAIEYLGRSDHQVKLRGFRIELGEIEVALAGHPQVREAVVVRRDEPPLGPRLVGYVVPRAEPPSASTLLAYLRARLPDYLVPASVIVLERLPLSAHGKVDRRALPLDAPMASSLASVAARDPVEEVIAGIFAEVLGLAPDAVGAHAGFFELGGHSLLGTRVLSRLRTALGVDLPLRALFDARTPAALGQRAHAAMSKGGGASPIRLERRASQTPVLSSGQERLWFLSQLDPSDPSYLIPLAYRLRGALDATAIETALRSIVERHAILRTRYRIVDDRPEPVVLAPAFTLTRANESPGDAEAAARAAITAASIAPFNLAAEPPMRARLVRLGERDHLLLITLHHIAADAWTLGILHRELGVLYSSLVTGARTALPELPLQYADYASWQRERLDGPLGDSQLAYWREQLAGASFQLDLPADHPRPPVPSRRGARRPVAFPAALQAELRALARSENATLFMVLLAALDVLLHRLTGQDDLLVGTPIANRSESAIEGLAGFFVSTLVLRARPSADQTFVSFLAAVKESCLGAYAHQEVPFERLVQALDPARDLGRSPLFQVALTLQNARTPPLVLPGIEVEEIEVDNGTAKFDLSLWLADTDEGLIGYLEHATDLFDASTVDRWIASLHVLLEALVRAPAARLAELPLLDPAEARRLDISWNDTERAYPREAGLGALFAAQVAARPEAPAIVVAGGDLSYRVVHQRASRLAQHLNARGVGPGARVGLATSGTVALVIGAIAIVLAGGAYVPLDPAYPAERLTFLIADAGLAGIVADPASTPRLPEGAFACVAIADDGDSPALTRTDVTLPASAGDALAYVIYTSGSTGLPKGVQVLQRSVSRLVLATDYVTLGPEDRVAQAASPSFDAATFEIWGPLLNGGCIVPVPREVALAPRRFIELLRAERVTTLFLTTALFNGTVREDPAAFRTVKTVLFGGEAVDPTLVRAALPQGPSRLLHVYGPTETTTFATWHLVEGVADDAMTVPIGQPITNTTAHVLDDQRALCPIGVPGELYLGGDGVALGYLDRPALTEARFLPDPFASTPGARLYRTGDRVRRVASGDLIFLGRFDHQIKLRGHRIELGEIEAALLAHPSVDEAIVVLREDAPGDKRLCAYVAGAEGAPPEVAALRRFLEAKLPGFMVPSAFMVLLALPLTANGKIDRAALPAPTQSTEGEGDHVPPRGPIEEAIAAVFTEVLHAPSVGAHDDFFALGGHSLLGARVIARIRAVFGVELPLRALFETPTPGALGARVAAALGAGEGNAAPLTKRATADVVLSFAQERLWLVEQLTPGDPSYLVPLAFRLHGALDRGALTGALTRIVERHEALRTLITAEHGRPVGALAQGVHVALTITEATSDPERAAREAIAEEARRPFDLAIEIPLRARLIALGPDEHLFLLTLHHIVADAWTLSLLERELGALYRSIQAGAPSPLLALPIQLSDHAAWQRERLVGPELERLLGYWTGRLRGAPFVLDLPLDRPRPPVESHRGARRSLALSPALTQGLVDLARREGVTLFMTFLGALDVLLHRHTGQADFVVGASTGNRGVAETERLLGFFVNALVLRAEVTGRESFRALLAQVKETCLGAYAHDELPFERLVQELVPGRDLGRSPLFQVMLTMQNAPTEGLTLPGMIVTTQAIESTTAKFDLTFLISEGATGKVVTIEYATDLFEPATIERMLDRYARLLEGIARTPEVRVADLPLLSDEERRTLLVDWNATESPFSPDTTLIQLFHAEVDRGPARVAVVAPDGELTYAELDARVNTLAAELRRVGVGPDVVVGLALERSLGLVIALLAVLAAGGAYLPLDLAHPPARLAQLVEEAQIGALITASLELGWAPAGVQVVSLATPRPAIEGATTPRIDGGAGPRNLAYVLFTSGSTGRPKAVAIEHRSIVSYVLGLRERVSLPAGGSYAHVSTFSADLGNTVLFPPLCLGGTLHVLSDDQCRDPDAFGAYTDAHPIDCLKIVPSHLAALLVGARPERVLPRRLLILGGEASSWALIARVEQLAPSLSIVNHYGPTETTVGVLTHALTRGERIPGAPIVPLGRPLPGARVYLLDAEMAPVPLGVPGEIYLGGAGVARGYLHRPDLTAERFVPDPFGADPAGRLYRTGDRARYLPGGTLVFLGRIDLQVKVRGHRIELGEVESVLLAHPSIREAVVIARGAGVADQQLVAYVVPSGSPGPDSAELRAFLEARLPGPMIPAAFMTLEALPLNANGKIDRAALPDVAPAAPASDDAPRDPIEELLAGIWAEVFGKRRIGIHERFADLGGHSLLAIQIIARAREAFRAAIPLRAIFEAPTIAELARVIAREIDHGEGLSLPPIEPAKEGSARVLSFAQERLWFLTQLEPDSPFYNVPLGLRLRGALDRRALADALIALVTRHEVLRTTVSTLEGRPVPIVRAPPHALLEWIDLSALPEDARRIEAERVSAVEAIRPFDLAEGPLVRATLLGLGAREHALIIVLHHIVSDAWTRDLLYRELADLYQAARDGRPARLPPLAIQYTDYAAWQRAWLTGEALERALTHARTALGGAPTTLDLPTDRPRPRAQSHRGGRAVIPIPDALGEALKALSRTQSTTLFMTLLAAFAVLLHRYTASTDLLIGSPSANRGREAIEPLLGFFASTLVLRARPSGDLPFEAFLAQIRETCLTAYAHDDLPFERLVQDLVPERDLTRAPLFQVMFTLQGGARPRLDLPGLAIEETVLDSGSAKFDLTLVVSDEPGHRSALIEYATDLFDPATIERMLAHLRVLLDAIVGSPSCLIRDLPLLPSSERTELLAVDRPRPSFATALIHQRFEAHVDRSPDAIAVTGDGTALTYGDLDRRANRLAHALRALGVGPEVRVGLCVGRSPELLVGILGILKAGGAYVPLDPDYPAERLAFLAEDSGITTLVTTSTHAATISREGLRLLALDTDRATLDRSPDTRPIPLAGPESLAYVIYTSGSTGTPKGALVTHANVTRLFTATDAWFHFDARDVWTLFHSFAFDFSVWEIWGALFHGGRLVLVPYWVSRAPDAFHALLRAEQVTVLCQTPSAFRPLAQHDVAATFPLSTVRYVIFGGEALDLGDLRAFWARHGDRHPALINMYGITETTVHVTYRPLRLADLERPFASVIGHPIPDLTVRVLDPDRNLAPIGVPGELYVGGAGVARGYLNRAALTAERFVPDPFSDPPGARLYRSGDRVRRLASGELEYLGRLDQQVKIRGHRIEPAEIEAVLTEHPRVRAAVVVARADAPGETRLVAYLVRGDGEPLTAGELRAFVKQRLPDPLVPSAFVLLDRLPLTAHGKIDHRALPAPADAERAPTGEAFAGPRSDIEHTLCRIWAAVLRVPAVGIHDNFFERGGDSISSIQIVAKAQSAGLRLTPRQIFEHQTIAEQAMVARPATASAASRAPVVGPVELLPIQRWWLSAEPEDAHHFNQALLFESREPLDPAILGAALSALVLHHDMLRVRLVKGDGAWEQSIAPPGAPASVETLDLAGMAASARAAMIEAEATRVQASLDLVAGPVVRALLILARPDAPDQLLLVVHHLAIDGVSWRFLLDDLWSAYAALRAGEPVVLPPKTTSFQRWAEALVAHARSGALAAQHAIWLDPARRRVAPIPHDFPGNDDREGEVAEVIVRLDEGETEALLREVPEAYHTQISDVLLTALAQTLARVTRSSAVLVDVEGHGREDLLPDLDPSRTVGWFTTLVPTLLTIDRDAAPGVQLIAVKEQLRAIPDRGIGHGLLRCFGGDDVERELASMPVAEVAWNYLGQLDQALPSASPLRWASGAIGPSKSPRQRRRHLLDLNAHILEGALRVRITYGPRCFRRTTIEALAEQLLDALRRLIAHCRSPGAGGLSPSDFRKVSLDQHELDDVLDDLPSDLDEEALG